MSKSVSLSPEELLGKASKHLGSDISLIEFGKLLVVCGLHAQNKYTQKECDHFIKACILKHKGMSYEKIAAESGIANYTKNVVAEEINNLLLKASLIQIEQIRAMMPQIAAEQLDEIKSLFWRMTSQRLRQYIESGDLEAEIRLTSNSRSGNLLGLLTISSPNHLSFSG